MCVCVYVCVCVCVCVCGGCWGGAGGNFIFQKLKTKLKNLLHSSHNIALSTGIIFAKKHWFFMGLDTKRYIFWIYMSVYLCVKFEFSSISLTSFRWGNAPPPPPQNEPLKSPPRLGRRSEDCSYIVLLWVIS